MNANTASNFVTVNQFTTPNMIINMSGLKINQKSFTFSLMLSGSMNGVIYSEPVEITGKVTVELMNWLTLVKDEKVQVKADNEKGFEWIKSGRRVTSFQRYLEKAGWGSIVDSPNTLEDLVFECSNTSEDYIANPFRLVTRLNGTATLTMVNIPSKKRIETINEETGEHTIRYTTKYGTFKDGTAVKAFIHPTKYRRYTFEEITQREVYVAPLVAE